MGLPGVITAMDDRKSKPATYLGIENIKNMTPREILKAVITIPITKK